jgi:predicted metal-dependent phosphotriesterase family hydrolase
LSVPNPANAQPATSDSETALSASLAPELLRATLLAPRILDGIDVVRFTSADQLDDAAVIAAADKLLRGLRAGGVGTLVDLTPIGYARSPAALARLADDTGVKLICATGIDLMHAPEAIRTAAPARLADLLIAELQETVAGADAPAPVISLLAAEIDAEQWSRLALTAAFAYAETGAPVVLTAASTQAAERVGNLIGRGIDPERIIVGGFAGPRATFADVDACAREGVLLAFQAVGDDVPATAALAAYAIRRHGPERVALTVAPALSAQAAHAALGECSVALVQSGATAEQVEVVITWTVDAILAA